MICLTLFLVGCQQNPISQPRPKETQTENTEGTVSQADLNLDDDQTGQLIVSGVFNEITYGKASDKYPASSLDMDLDTASLLQAVDDYYTQEYSPEEKAINQEPIDSQDLNLVKKVLENNEIIQDLDAKIDQVEMTLAGETAYVARIVVPYSYAQAQSIVDRNDYILMNESLAQLGNRLVMIAYYDQDNNTLVPYHLTNRTKPLFTYNIEE